MRMGSVLVIFAILSAILGAGLSYSGYDESLHIVTVTSTQQITATSTIVRDIATITSSFGTTITEVVLGDTISIDAPGREYCGIWAERYLSIDSGQVAVSFNSVGGPVDFWMLTETQWEKWNSTRGCDSLLRVPAIASRFGSISYDITKNVESSGMYHFVFLNRNSGSVYVHLKIESSRQVTVIKESTSFSTEIDPLVTSAIIVSSRPAGLGLVFYLGIALIVTAAVITTVGRRKGTAAGPTRVLTATPVVPPVQLSEPVPAVTTSKRYCIDCGASLPVHAIFCNKCGAHQ